MSLIVHCAEQSDFYRSIHTDNVCFFISHHFTVASALVIR